jgi:hypothetical protein
MDKKQTNAQNPLGTEPVGGLLRKFAIPSIVAMLVGALYNIVDQFFHWPKNWGIGKCCNECGLPAKYHQHSNRAAVWDRRCRCIQPDHGGRETAKKLPIMQAIPLLCC